MHRRGFLAGAGLAGTVALQGATALAGCAGLSPGGGGGFEPPPVLDDPPAGVYVPTHSVGSRLVGVRDVGDYRVALAYSHPVRFWTVAGTRIRPQPVEDDDAVHLLVTVWEPETGVVLPDAGVTVEVLRDRTGESVYEEVVYPMLAGGVGVHNGDNVPLPGEGDYAVRVTVGGPGGRPRGGFAGRFEGAATAEFAFAYSREERDSLPAEATDHRAGEPGALEPRQPTAPADGEPAADRVPAGRVPAADDLPSRFLGRVEDGDAVFAVSAIEGEESGEAGPDEDGAYLAVSARTRYNRLALAAMGLIAELRRDGEAVFSGALRAAIDPALGYHYGAAVASVEAGDVLSVEIPTNPQVARHEGYETAFTGLDGFEILV